MPSDRGFADDLRRCRGAKRPETEQLLTDWASIEMRRSPSRPSTVTWSITLSSAVTRMSDAAGSTVTRIPRETCREW